MVQHPGAPLKAQAACFDNACAGFVQRELKRGFRLEYDGDIVDVTRSELGSSAKVPSRQHVG